MNKVKSINYLFKDNFRKSVMYQLDVINCKETNINILGSKKNIKEATIEDNLALKKMNLFMTLINSWNEKYINNKVLDGFELKILVEYENNKTKSVYSKNKFPPNFSEFKSLLGDICYE